jgi:acetyltransferase-like isoleucine patch superfamily enzyme
MLKRVLLSRGALLRISSFKELPIVHGFSLFNRKTSIGHNTNFNGFRVYGDGQVIIGDNFHSGSGCSIITQVHNYKGSKLPYDESYEYKNVEIQDNVWFGMNVMVLATCVIGEGAIIQAGAVVVSDIPALSIAGGNPARVFGSRDSNHYYELKKARQFH